MGGIYTVLQTKAKVTGDEWGDNYFLVGPYTEQGVRTQVELLEAPTPALKRTLDSMNSKGCKVGHGPAQGRSGWTACHRGGSHRRRGCRVDSPSQRVRQAWTQEGGVIGHPDRCRAWKWVGGSQTWANGQTDGKYETD